VDSHPTTPIPDDHEPPKTPAKRALLLRILYRVYANYLGVTPPTPSQERTAAVILIGGVVIGLAAVVLVVFFLWRTMAQLGGR
jgi:hypothetical protein